MRAQSKALKYLLQGVCSDSRADSFYLLKPGGWFEGFVQSRLVFSPARARWEILDSLDQRVVASLNHTQDYPLGINYSRDNWGEILILEKSHPEQYKHLEYIFTKYEIQVV